MKHGFQQKGTKGTKVRKNDMSKNAKRVAVQFKDEKAGLCDACGRAILHKVDLVRAAHWFEAVVGMFEKGHIKQFILTPSDSEKLRVLLDAAEKELPGGCHLEQAPE